MAWGFKGVVGVLVASSLFVTSSAAVAAISYAPTSPVAATQISPWAALTAMSGGASASAMCGAAAVAAAAQTPGGCVLPPVDVPPPSAQSPPPPQPIPVPPVEAPGGLGLELTRCCSRLAFLLQARCSISPSSRK